MIRRAAPLFLGCLLLAAAGCVPTAARKNARLEAGGDLDLSGGGNYLLAGEDEDGERTAPEGVLHLEADFQYASLFDNRSGLALQLKVPLNVFFTTFDLYYQMPNPGPSTYYGFGAELGITPGVYAAFTRYFGSLYVTFTPRVLAAHSADSFQLNPQLALGVDDFADLSVFFSYAYHTGDGINLALDLVGEDNQRDWRKRYFLAGASARF